jgi:RNA polymerase sigma-70 factor (ECF subfamily)
MNITMRYIRDRADAEDAVQNTFLKAFRGLKHFRGDASFYTWLHRIAVNSAMTARSRRAREARMFVDEVRYEDRRESAVASSLDTPEWAALTAEVYAAVNAAIDALGEHQRTAISLREFHGLSYLEIAAEMSCSIGTVRSRVARARDSIGNQLRAVFDGSFEHAQQNLALSDHQ